MLGGGNYGLLGFLDTLHGTDQVGVSCSTLRTHMSSPSLPGMCVLQGGVPTHTLSPPCKIPHTYTLTGRDAAIYGPVGDQLWRAECAQAHTRQMLPVRYVLCVYGVSHMEGCVCGQPVSLYDTQCIGPYGVSDREGCA